jgi:hypothetical protein
VELEYTAVREAAPERVWGVDSPRWHPNEQTETVMKKRKRRR